jgi:hypothetical protein
MKRKATEILPSWFPNCELSVTSCDNYEEGVARDENMEMNLKRTFMMCKRTGRVGRTRVPERSPFASRL